ncbi:hypothetical protein ERX35_005635 [Macrococcus equipercicus]|uniref:Uncharacterized protein n=2 Tax=Macrococcus equipercicus TaxID=69967 RepID=A0ABQ6R8U5_9STAP|nr:hypothetical protein ERX35_005635 [Macrococcus equipercicus]
MMIKTACKIKTFNFRMVNFPGELILDTTNQLIIFNPLLEAAVNSHSIPIDEIETYRFKKGMLKSKFEIYYRSEWYIFTDFTDENYLQIVSYLEEIKDERHLRIT